MSPSKSYTGIVSAALAAVGAAAIAAAFAIGMTGWPPAQASAQPVFADDALGVDATPIALGEPASVDDKFDDMAESTEQIESSAADETNPRRISVPAVGEGRRVPAGFGQGWQTAHASWYGPGFYGNGMAGGGKLQHDSMVVAHKTLPFGTKIQFIWNGRTTTAVVRDRGPFIPGREFDLGPGTAKVLGFAGVGTIRYRIVK